jgi:putative ABC transport system permease protein
MLKNYLITAWGNLRKNLVFSAINIGGLAVGLAVCMLMTEYLEYE